MSPIHSVEKRKFFVCNLILILAFLFVFLSPSILSVSAFATSTSQQSLSPLKAGYPKTLTSPNRQYEGNFGWSVAIGGKFSIVGAPQEVADGQSYAGHAYVYNSSTVKLVQTLTSPNADNGGYFGNSVAISGNLAIVGAYGERLDGDGGFGHAYIFNATTGGLIHTLSNPTGQLAFFGYSVSISGNLAIVSAPIETADGYTSAGQAYVFNASSGKLIQNLTSPNVQLEAHFGTAVAISGQDAIVGADNQSVDGYVGAGQAYVFDADTGQVIETLSSPNSQTGGTFGGSVAMSGKVAIVGAEWETVDGYTGAGRAYVFDADTGKLLQTLTSPDLQSYSFFGTSVAISGNFAIVGGYDENGGTGGAYVYKANTGKLIQTLTSRHAQNYGLFGWSVGISGKLEIVGAPYETADGFYQAGHAYLFKE